MSDVIKLLPDAVANQIAAGEVVQRPASVVKELVENAVDAGATDIKIILKDAGKALIQIVDNGCGMSETDARLAFERHSTSKIRKAEDLFSLTTMGFRGEALASICAVSQVELRTQRASEQAGTMLIINGSECERQEPIYFSDKGGSCFMVKNLFYNIPARRKFLKSNSIELSNVLKEFERLALVNYDKSMLISDNDKVLHQLNKGTFRQRIIELFGKTLEKHLIPLELNTTLVKLSGFICRPENSRKRGAQQFLFVNGRYMRHPYFHKAILSCYEQLIPTDHQPNYFINFTVAPDTIDVNIHPTKTEIKFENEQSIWQILVAGVRESLGKFSFSPTIDFDREDAVQIPVFDSEANTTMPSLGLHNAYNPFADNSQRYNPSTATSDAPKGGYIPSRLNTDDWEGLYKSFLNERPRAITYDEAAKSDIIPSSLSIESDDDKAQLPSSLFGEPIAQAQEAENNGTYLQLCGKYIATTAKSGLMLIDQHRAHLKILYEKLRSEKRADVLNSQKVLFPEVFRLTQSQTIVLESIQDDIEEVGVVLSYLGNNDWSISAVPAELKDFNLKDAILQLVESVEHGAERIGDKILDHICLQLARSAAMPYGKALSIAQMTHIQHDLMQLPTPNYTPDGKTIIQVLTIEDIAKRF